MINLSRAKVNKRIPKNRFKAELLDVDAVTWLYKISAETADFRHGDDITEIQIFSVAWKGAAANKRELAAIQKIIPYPILFIAGSKSYFTIEGDIYESEKEFLSGDKLLIEHRTAKLTDLYEDIAAAFITIERREAESIADFAARYKRLQELDRDIASLQRKIDTEKQTNKRFAFNEELKRLKKEKEMEELE